jgi:hypothetical protein
MPFSSSWRPSLEIQRRPVPPAQPLLLAGQVQSLLTGQAGPGQLRLVDQAGPGQVSLTTWNPDGS